MSLWDQLLGSAKHDPTTWLKPKPNAPLQEEHTHYGSLRSLCGRMKVQRACLKAACCRCRWISTSFFRISHISGQKGFTLLHVRDSKYCTDKAKSCNLYKDSLWLPRIITWMQNSGRDCTMALVSRRLRSSFLYPALPTWCKSTKSSRLAWCQAWSWSGRMFALCFTIDSPLSLCS